MNEPARKIPDEALKLSIPQRAEVAAELLAATLSYEAQRPGLGREFRDEVAEARDRLTGAP